MQLKKTPLFQEYKNMSCKMGSFAGWEMPMHFSSVIEEHEAVRKNAGIFDISHMGAILLTGEKPKENLQKLVPSDIFRIGPGEACYTVLLNNNGGIIDDLIIYDLGINKNNEEEIILIINAACSETDIAWLQSNLLPKVRISDFKQQGVLMAIQGPKSQEYLEEALGQSISSIPRFGHKRLRINSKDCNDDNSVFIARTGYTGEEGFECLMPAKPGQSIWQRLLTQGVQPCGLGARDTLRLEAGMHLYGNEMNSTTTPFEAGLGWLVHLEMPSHFIGREALEKQTEAGITKKLVGLTIEGRGIARKGYKIIHKEKVVGEITSGSWSPSLKKAIALAYISKDLTTIGTTICVDIRGKETSAKVVKKPFYQRTY